RMAAKRFMVDASLIVGHWILTTHAGYRGQSDHKATSPEARSTQLRSRQGRGASQEQRVRQETDGLRAPGTVREPRVRAVVAMASTVCVSLIRAPCQAGSLPGLPEGSCRLGARVAKGIRWFGQSLGTIAIQDQSVGRQTGSRSYRNVSTMNIYVGNLPHSATEQQVRTAFE